MEHFASTIATTAVLVAGLITAAQVLHPRDPAFETRRSRQAVATVASPWSDPPERASQAVEAPPPSPRPASFTLMPAALAANPWGAATPLQPQRVRRAEAVRGPRLVPHGTRARSVVLQQDARADLPNARSPEAGAQPAKAVHGDPIGDLLTTLGIGGEG